MSSAKDMGDAVARVVWTGSREVAENLLESIIPDDPESFESEIVESEDGVSLTILISSSELSELRACLLYTSPSPRDISGSRMPSSA